jgi:hypothetical protein
MGGTCRMHGGDEKMRTKFWLENLKERDQSEDQDVRGLRKKSRRA